MRSEIIRKLAFECGFELCGVTPAVPVAESGFFHEWLKKGYAAGMGYLTDYRAGIRSDPRHLLPSARSIICVGKLYNTRLPYSTEFGESDAGWISRYAWGEDYHKVLRAGLKRLAQRMEAAFGGFESRICVDTAPLLERAYARRAGLGWIGKNSCLIHEGQGSWFFLGELLVSLELEADGPPPDRCGTCTRCIEACPTQAIVPAEGPGWTVDSRLCISYHTIEHRGSVPEPARSGVGRHIFGCDICQDVCPWNAKAPAGPQFQPAEFAPHLARMAALTENEFRAIFQGTPVNRAKYAGFLRNVALAMGNSRREEFRRHLYRLAEFPDRVVSEQARWSLAELDQAAGRQALTVLQPSHESAIAAQSEK